MNPRIPAVDPTQTYVFLAADGSSVQLPGGAAFWARPQSELDAFGQGWLVSEFECAADWENWEMHPHGDEFVYLLAGKARFELQAQGRTTSVFLDGRGAVVVPRGVWHTAKVSVPSRMLFVTRGSGTEHRPVVTGRLGNEEAIDFVRRHGVVLVSAQGKAPNLVQAIAGEPIKGSWWGHPDGKRIHAVLGTVTESDEVLVCRLVAGKITLVHRRLWPALARLADAFAPEQIARVLEGHTPSGRHVSRAIPFPDWLPQAVRDEAGSLDESKALALLGEWLPPSALSARRKHS